MVSPFLLAFQKYFFFAPKFCTNQFPSSPCILQLPDDKSDSGSLTESSHHKLPERRGLSENINRVCHFYVVSRVTDLPRQMVPFPTYPGLQVQLCPLTVLVQIAFSSQLCCPLLHSSCSTSGKKKYTRETVSFSVWWCGIWKPSGITRLAQWLNARSLVWESAMALLQLQDSACVWWLFMFKNSKKESARRISTNRLAQKNYHRRISVVKTNSYITVCH